MAVPVTKVVGRPDPFTVIILENVRLGAYATGGVDVSVPGLTVVDSAVVHIGRASGAEFTSGFPWAFHVTSGSGNVVTITAGHQTSSLEAPAGTELSSYPLTLIAYGH